MKKGFTLIELLATIIVLAIISMIAIGVVSNSIDASKKKTFEINASNLLDAAKEYVIKNMENNDFPEDGIEANSKEIGIKNNPFISGIIKRNEEGQIELENVTDGKYCANGVKSNIEVTEGNCETIDDTPPTLKIKELKTTRNSSKIMIKIQDSGSGIKEYEYCVNEKCTIVQKKKEKDIIKEVITIKELKPNTIYKIKVTAVNGVTKETRKTIEIKTKELEEPKFKISTTTYATTKKLTIIYPEIEGEYQKFYKIKEVDKLVEINKNEIELDIEENRTVRAYIEQAGEEIVYNEIIISGIDQEGPIVNVTIPEIDNWTKEKKVTINAEDIGVGLALKPYINNGYGEVYTVWNREKEIILKSSGFLNIKVRDRLGNINSMFKLNGIECKVDGETLCAINKIDSVGPKIEIKVIEGTKITKEKYKEWYNSDRVIVEIKLTDQYLYNGEETIGGSGIKEDTLVVKVNDIEVIPTKIGENLYTIILRESKENKITASVSDNVGNITGKNVTIKLDNILPSIKIKSNPLRLGNVDYKFIDNLEVTYGPTGGISECNPATSLKTGIYIVKCKAIGNNGKIASGDTGITFTARHSYPAHSRQEAYTYNCNPYSCVERYNCKVETGVSSVCVRYEHDQNGNNGVHCVEQVDTPWRHESCDERETTCYSICNGTRTIYYCDNDGSTLSGQTCYY